jgi:glutathione S-transferase
MPIIEPGNPDLKKLKGIHLWHGGLSNCSQRCRIALSELGLQYEGHLVNLHAAEHATEEFQQINPNGVLPALIHDGTLIIESVDIIAYLDENFGDGSLRPARLEDEIATSLEHGDELQLPLKYCTFEFLFKHGPPVTEETFQKLMSGLHSESLKTFHRENRAGFSREKIHDMVGRAHKHFLRCEESFNDGREWMAGDVFTLADIVWMPNFHRFDLMGWPLDSYPQSNEWFRRASARNSYKEALEGWEPQALFDLVFPALEERRANNDGIDSYGPFATQ